MCYSCGAVNPCDPEALPPPSPKGTKRDRDVHGATEPYANQSIRQFDDDNEEDDDESDRSSDDADEDENGEDEDKENACFRENEKEKVKRSGSDDMRRLKVLTAARFANGVDNIASNLFRSDWEDKENMTSAALYTGVKKDKCTPAKPFRSVGKKDKCTPAKACRTGEKSDKCTPAKGPLASEQCRPPLQIPVDVPPISIPHHSPTALQVSSLPSVQYRSPTRPLSLSPVPEMLSTSVLLATLETRANEIHMLHRKLQRSEAERLVAENRLKTLQAKFLQTQTDREENSKPKKRKTVIQRVVEAVSCNVDRKNVYSPKGKVMSPRAF